MVSKWPTRWFTLLIFVFLIHSIGLLFILHYNIYYKIHRIITPLELHNFASYPIKASLSDSPLSTTNPPPKESSLRPTPPPIGMYDTSPFNTVQTVVFESKPFRLLKTLWQQVTSDSPSEDHMGISQPPHKILLPTNIHLKNCSVLAAELKEGGFLGSLQDSLLAVLQFLWPQEPLESLPLCPTNPPHLKGRISIRKELNRVREHLLKVRTGGVWAPRECKAREKLVLIVPYRRRKEHLDTFIPYMHRFLQRQLLDYRVVVVEQQGKAEFNRGALMNIGFHVASELQEVHCAIFHDIDLLPEHEFNSYRCGSVPRHMSVAVSSFAYKLPYPNLFGGIEAFRSDQFRGVNGFSNLYFGWGGEDDDLFKRVYLNGLQITRYPAEIATYTMLKHSKQSVNPRRFDLLKASTYRQEKDGLLLAPLDSCLGITLLPLHTHVTVSLDRFYNEAA